MDLLLELEKKENDSNFLDLFASAKLSGKRKLAGFIHRQTGVLVDPSSLFDVQVKRIHQYKRQHLNDKKNYAPTRCRRHTGNGLQ